VPDRDDHHVVGLQRAGVGPVLSSARHAATLRLAVTRLWHALRHDDASSARVEPRNGLDRYFSISARGSSVRQELRGGAATFFTMAYIVVLNPLIIGTQPDVDGRVLGSRRWRRSPRWWRR
jgi:hypothetical protein